MFAACSRYEFVQLSGSTNQPLFPLFISAEAHYLESMNDPNAIEEFERTARQAFENIPPPFADYLGDIVLRIDEWPSREILDHFELDSPLQLCGLYQGVPVGEKSPWSIPNGQGDRITLYRRPLLNEMQATGVDLDKLIQHVVIHEVGHHFGLSDADMHEIDDRADD